MADDTKYEFSTDYEIKNPYIITLDRLIQDFKLRYTTEILGRSDLKALFDEFVYKSCFNDHSNNLNLFLYIKKQQQFILDIFIQERLKQKIHLFKDDYGWDRI